MERVHDLDGAIDLLLREINGLGFDYKASSKLISKRFRCYHRTIQQNIIRLVANVINEVKEHPTDLRNEASINWCKQVSRVPNQFPYI